MSSVSNRVLPAGAASSNLKQPPKILVPAAVRHMESIGRLPRTRALGFSVSIPLRDTETLDALLADLYDPSSPRFRQFLSADDFARRFGPSRDAYDAMLAFARTSRFEVAATHSNRALITLRASVADLEAAFGIELHLFQHPIESRTFYAPQNEPQARLAHLPLLGVNGLDDYSSRKAPLSIRREPRARSGPAAGSSPGGALISSDLRAAYAPGVALMGSGETVGIFTPGHGFDPADIVAYQKAAGITPLVPVETVSVDGVDHPVDNFSTEVTLDIDMAIAMAPGLSRVLVYNGTDGISVLNRIATDNQARQISSSWPTPDEGGTADQIYKQLAAQGQTFFCASGDAGSYYPTQPFSADDPYITVVAGTQLTISPQTSAWTSEVVWNDPSFGSSGGGTMNRYPLPNWQENIDMTLNQGSTTSRNSPDVAIVGSDMFIVVGGNAAFVEGTSVAAPLWAGYMALINQLAAESGKKPIGMLNPSLYALGKCSGRPVYFHDITEGNNLTKWNTQPNHAKQYFAVPGYDCCTGWGTPTGSNLINAIGRDGPPQTAVTSASIVAVSGQDGRINLLSIDTNKSVWRISQTGPNANWSPWFPLSGNQIRQVVAAQNADGRVEAFALGGDKTVYHVWETSPNGGWGTWVGLGGHQLKRIAVARNADGRLEFFGLGDDGAISHTGQTAPNGNWGPWTTLAGHDLRELAVAVNADGRLEVFALGGDRAVYHIWQVAPNGSWSAWANLGGHALQQLAVGSDLDGRLELFALGSDGAVYNAHQTAPNAGWSVWGTLAGNKLSQLCVASNAAGQLEIVGLGADHAAYHLTQSVPNGSWGTWASLQGHDLQQLTLARNADGRLELFALGADRAVYHRWQSAPNAGWKDWAALG